MSKKISELTELTIPATDDELVIVDNSEVETKKITLSNLKASGTDIDTGTEDVKFVTPKAIEDSNLLRSADVINDLTTGGTTNPLSAEQGKELQNAKLENVVEDTTPQLGGALDTNGNNIDDVTPTELSYVHGVTSDIQTQLNDKLSKASGGTVSGTVTCNTINDRVYAKYALLNPSASVNIGTVNAGANGGLIKILAHGQSGSGNETYAAEYLIRLGYNGDHYSYIKYDGVLETLTLTFSVTDGDLIVQTTGYNVILYVERYG